MISIAFLRRAGFLGCCAIAASLAVFSHASRSASEQRFPDVLEVKVTAQRDDVFDFDVTVSSPYDTAARYADGFRATTESGEVLGERKLLHDHQGEQPFTRDLYGVRVPRGVTAVVIQARDRKYGYGGKSVRVPLPGR